MRRDALYTSLGERNRKRDPRDGRSRWQALTPEQRERVYARRQIRRQVTAQQRQQTPESKPEDHPQYRQRVAALEAQWQAQITQYERGLALHPVTGAYKGEETMPPARRGALVAWRKGYRVSEDGRFWHPQGYELFPGYTSQITDGPKHHRAYRDPAKRTRQKELQYRPEILAALCFYGPVALANDRRVRFRDGNKRNRSKANLELLTATEWALRRRKTYRGTVQTVNARGRKKSPTGPNKHHRLTAEQAQAIRTLLALGKTREEVQALLRERQMPLALTTISAIDRGSRWR